MWSVKVWVNLFAVTLNFSLVVIYLHKQNNSGDFHSIVSRQQINVQNLVTPYEDEGPRLTDVVIPFPPSHVERVLDNIRLWKKYPPCFQSNSVPRSLRGQRGKFPEDTTEFYLQNNYSLGHNITLTFFLSTQSDQQIGERILEEFSLLPEVSRQCFKEVRMFTFNLTGEDDGYWMGTRKMFEAFLDGEAIDLVNPHYALYMEPDLVPMRKYWLTALDATSRHNSQPFWVKGSLFRGYIGRGHWDFIQLCTHINGNAIYNLADPKFKQFYFAKVAPIAIQDPGNQHAYDVDFYFVLADAANFNETREVLHLFQYTDTIQNYWHMDYSLDEVKTKYPFVYLIHGGNQYP